MASNTRRSSQPATRSSPFLHAGSNGSTPTSNSSTFRRTDVVKSGHLYMKKPYGLLNFKKWHERVLVLRDTWTEACQGGVTSLEVYHPSSSSNKLDNMSKIPKKNPFISVFSCFSKLPQKEPSKEGAQGDKGNTSKYNGLKHKSHISHSHIDHCYIDLRTVSSVDEHSSCKCFPYAFVLHRNEKESVVFGAKTEFEAREWMVAVRHLASKAHQAPLPMRKTPSALTFEERLESMRRSSREDDVALTNVPLPPPRPKARRSNP